jgi:hypothetical protein
MAGRILTDEERRLPAYSLELIDNSSPCTRSIPRNEVKRDVRKDVRVEIRAVILHVLAQ